MSLQSKTKNRPYEMEMRGIDEMLRNLDRIASETARKAPSKAVRAGGKVIISEMKKQAPVDTGKLKRNLSQKIKTYRKDKNVVSIIGAKWKEDKPKSKDPGFYIYMNEFAGAKLGTSHKPFAKKSFDTASDEARRVVINTIKQAFTQASKRYSVK